jgi:hypothetical protein
MVERTFTLDEIKEIGAALGLQQKHTPASTTLYTPTLQGPYQGSTSQFGIFTTPGVRPERFSALARPDSFAQALGAPVRSEYYEELLEIFTGQTAASCTNAAGPCGNPPEVGIGKVCKQHFLWGFYYVKTQLNALAEIGQLRNRSDVPGSIINVDPTMRNPLIPDLFYRLEDGQSQLQYELWRLGVEFERSLDVVAIAGSNSQAYTATECGWTKEMSGLDNMIKDGHTDAVTGVACPAMDSMVITFGADVGGTIGSGDGRNIVIAITELVRAGRERARKMGYGNGVQYYFLMRSEAFHRIVEEYSCDYATYRCTGATNLNNVTISSDSNNLRLQMIAGQYILVDGDPIPVVFSEGIAQTNSAGTFTSDIYLVPASWNGMPLTYLQYYPMDNQYTTEFANFAGNDVETLNNGLWIVGSRSTGLCKELHFQAKMRLILETPFLAGRIDNISYTFTSPIRNALPGSSFYADGGATVRS